MDANQAAFPELHAGAHWACIEFISDLHLHPEEPATFGAWKRYLDGSTADAIFILGDLFEVWVGDDAAIAGTAAPSFEAECADLLRRAAARRPVYFVHGNRDFLVGEALFAQTAVRPLADPTVLCFVGERYLLSHGDALCLSDVDYQAFRKEVRSQAWQQAFLSHPLSERRAMARDIRAQSEARKRILPVDEWHDLDTALVRAWLQFAQASTLIHGHTHQPALHDLGDHRYRIVLSDWDLGAQPPRAQVLQLLREEGAAQGGSGSRRPGFKRIDIG